MNKDLDSTAPQGKDDSIKIRYVDPTIVSNIERRDGLLNIEEEHTGEEIKNSNGFYKRVSIEEFKELYKKHYGK